MSRQFPNGHAVIKGTVGRRLDIEPGGDTTHDKALEELTSREHLYAACMGLTTLTVVCVDSPAEFERITVDWVLHSLAEVNFYALNEEEHAQAE